MIKPDTLKDLLFKKFEDAPPLHEEVDPLSNGDFEVIKQLLATVPDAVRAKEKMDKIIDKCGNPPRGVGIQNLRTCIAEVKPFLIKEAGGGRNYILSPFQTKWKFDVSPEERQGAFKVMIINFIERYFYLLCFCMYCLEFGSDGYEVYFTSFFIAVMMKKFSQKSFHDYMDSKPELRQMASEGKDKLEWSRTVDAEKLEKLKEMMASPDYKVIREF